MEEDRWGVGNCGRSQQLMGDLWGHALLDYYQGIFENQLILHAPFGEPEVVPLKIFFRNKAMLSDLEVFALDLCRSPIIDIGAGAGCHAYILQESNHPVTALEKSPGACRVMRLRGVRQVVQKDLFSFKNRGFQTALMMMNGLGLAGSLDKLSNLLQWVFTLLTPDGQIIADSSDIRYLYDNQSIPTTRYYGELDYYYEYRGMLGPTFSWLFVDIDRLKLAASKVRLRAQLVFEEEDQYLARITK